MSSVTAAMRFAAPSELEKRSYEIIRGRLDDLDLLKPMREGIILGVSDPPRYREAPKKGARNNRLWRHCMSQAHHTVMISMSC
jgi:hypothetical protein